MQSQFTTGNFDGLISTPRESDDLRDGPSVDEGTDGDDDDELELPVDPDEGMPVIPDDERVIDVPS